MTIRPRRSVLYMPGSNARAIEKARTLAADTIVLDLEDSVAPEAKAAARKQVMEAVTAGFGSREVAVRVNAPDSEWWVEDLNMAIRAKPDAILIPKVSDTHPLEDLAERLIDFGADPKTRVWAMIETPLAVLNIREVAAAAKDVETRLSLFIIGTNDLAKETGMKLSAGRAAVLPWLTTCILAARAYGLGIIDGVYNDLKNIEGFEAECAQGRELGFDGKSLIHPNQIEVCNAAFSPSADEVAQARNIIAVFDQPENARKGVVAMDGRMVERLHADMARRTVAIADAIAQHSES